MKQKYSCPELELIKLCTEDILTGSKDDETYVDGGDLWEE